MGLNLDRLERHGLVNSAGRRDGETFAVLRERSKAAGYRVFLGNPCAKNHIGYRYCADGKCVECGREKKQKIWANADTRRKEQLCSARWRGKHPERHKRQFKRWRLENLEHDRQASREWQKNNPARAIAANAKRKSSLLKATPSWADDEAIQAIYAERDKISKETGIPHDVDHIIPLQGKNVSGFHVPENLRVVTATENRRKGNRYV